MSPIDELLSQLVEVNDRLGSWYRAIDLEWGRLQQQHNARAGNPYGFTAHLEEMSEQAIAAVKEDPRQMVYAVLDQIADAFLALPGDKRRVLEEFFADCQHLERIHRGYIAAHAARHLQTARDPVWLRRGLAVAALGQGGSDIRDLHLALAALWDAARKVGLAPGPAFQSVAELASIKRGLGGLQGSIRDFLAQYRR